MNYLYINDDANLFLNSKNTGGDKLDKNNSTIFKEISQSVFTQNYNERDCKLWDRSKDWTSTPCKAYDKALLSSL